MLKQAQQIEVGAYEDKVGFTMIFQNGEKEHFLFTPAVALRICDLLIKVASAFKYYAPSRSSDVQVMMAEQVPK